MADLKGAIRNSVVKAALKLTSPIHKRGKQKITVFLIPSSSIKRRSIVNEVVPENWTDG
jgi:hypothetical protein